MYPSTTVYHNVHILISTLNIIKYTSVENKSSRPPLQDYLPATYRVVIVIKIGSNQRNLEWMPDIQQKMLTFSDGIAFSLSVRFVVPDSCLVFFLAFQFCFCAVDGQVRSGFIYRGIVSMIQSMMSSLHGSCEAHLSQNKTTNLNHKS